MLNKEDLEKLLLDLEAPNLERTESLKDRDKIAEAICSFANDYIDSKQPGYLILGVNDQGEPIGLKKDDTFQQLLLDFRNDGRIIPPPELTVLAFEFPKGYVYVVEVQPSKLPPVRYKGNIHIRVGGRKSKSNEAEERKLIEKRRKFTNQSFETQPCFDSSLTDISLDIYKLNYLPKAISDEVLKQNGRELEEQMASLKLYDLNNGCPTNVAILMFGVSPTFFIPGAYIQYLKFNGESEVDVVREVKFEGDLVTQLKIINDFITTQIEIKTLTEIGGKYISNIPANALKELLFNAIIHRDYQSNAPIRFYEYSNRIEIQNNGGLYGNASENFPNVNDYRNPIIASMCKQMGYVNQFNVGIKRAKKYLEDNGNPSPDFQYGVNYFLVIVYKI
jgi:ATP-dependent DNA helicase RecG